jgi:hypothetical protein
MRVTGWARTDELADEVRMVVVSPRIALAAVALLLPRLGSVTPAEGVTVAVLDRVPVADKLTVACSR